jgi:hypothetical protein
MPFGGPRQFDVLRAQHVDQRLDRSLALEAAEGGDGRATNDPERKSAAKLDTAGRP